MQSSQRGTVQRTEARPDNALAKMEKPDHVMPSKWEQNRKFSENALGCHMDSAIQGCMDT